MNNTKLQEITVKEEILLDTAEYAGLDRQNHPYQKINTKRRVGTCCFDVFGCDNIHPQLSTLKVASNISSIHSVLNPVHPTDLRATMVGTDRTSYCPAYNGRRIALLWVISTSTSSKMPGALKMQ
jgi:hypothetical protein